MTTKQERQAIVAAKFGTSTGLYCETCDVALRTEGPFATGHSTWSLRNKTVTMCAKCSRNFRTFKAKKRGLTPPKGKRQNGEREIR